MNTNQQKLSIAFFLSLLALACSTPITQAMDEQKNIANAEAPTLKKLCLECINSHADELNVISQLPYIPTDGASDILLNTKPAYIAEHKDDLASLVYDEKLNHDAACSAAIALYTYKNQSNQLISNFLLDIDHMPKALTSGNLNPTMLSDFINVYKFALTSATPISKQEQLKNSFTVFCALASKIIDNQSSNNLAMNEELLKELSVSKNECVKQLNALHAYNSTIATHNLVRTIAKNNTISPDLANSMIADFVHAEIPDNFDTLFDAYFSTDMLQNNNEKELYYYLSHAPLAPAIQKSTDHFSIEEFENQLPATLEKIENNPWLKIQCNTHKKYKGGIHSNFLDALSCDKILSTSINPESGILLIHYETDTVQGPSFVGIINTKTLISMQILCSPAHTIKQIGLNSDCSQLGIMSHDDTINAYLVPKELTTLSLSLKQRALILYSNQKLIEIYQVMSLYGGCNTNDMGSMFKAITRLSFDTIKKFIDFIQNHKNIIPESLCEIVFNNRIAELENFTTMHTDLKIVADTLNLDLETACDKISSNEITPGQFREILNAKKSVETKEEANEK